MAGVKFTPSQQEAIEKKGTNIIVSAGAGSGKTAVLVERIINKIIQTIIFVFLSFLRCFSFLLFILSLLGIILPNS